MKRILRATAAVYCLTLGACSGLTPGGLIAVSRLDPLTTPPSEMGVAVGVPATLRLADGDARLRIAFFAEGASATPLVDATAPLLFAPNTAIAPQPNAANETVYVGMFSKSGAGRIAAAQQEIRDLRAAGSKGKGSLSVSVEGGCFEGTRPDSLYVSTWIKTAEQREFLALTRRADAADAIGRPAAALLLAELKPCPPDSASD